nr:LOW QUALITY PROTEIN: leucine-rich repeat and immunoglobulin-like domain-containing nogo receptor-interacting protein 3 [Lytechinus pictus]
MDCPSRSLIIGCIFFSFVVSVSPCPPRCRCDPNQKVSCTGSNLTTIPSGLPNTTLVLHLDRNGIEIIRQNAFSNIKYLEELSIAQNRLYEIESGAFTGMSNLDKLFLNDNLITGFPSGIFAPLIKLTELNLGGNRFPVIPGNLFGSMPLLGRLFLGSNEVDLFIESQAFGGLVNLAELSLRSSRIKSLSPGTFQGLNNLLILDLSMNTFGTPTRDGAKAISSLKGTQHPNAGLNELGEGIFADLKSLTDLNMSSCTLTTINKELFRGLTSLQHLYLSGNKLDGIVENTFANRRSSATLELDGNPLENIEVGSFNCLNQLGYLNLNHTRIGRTKGTLFRELHQLVVVSLSHSGLEKIADDSFQNKSRLTRIDLSDNDIDWLNASMFYGTPQIGTLRLQNNQIRRLPENLFADVAGPLNLSLKGNPLVCDCQLDWISGWLLKNGGNLDKCLCDQPSALHGLHLDSIPYDRFHCKPYIVTDIPQIYNATPGDKRFELVCPVGGKPPPTITWTIPSGEKISKNTVHEYENGLYRVRENDSLVIREITSAVQGWFTCEATNILGHISVDLEVKVVHVPSNWMVAFLVVMIVLFIGCAVCLVVTFLKPCRRRRRRRELIRTPARRVDPRYGPLSPIAEGNETDEL